MPRTPSTLVPTLALSPSSSTQPQVLATKSQPFQVTKYQRTTGTYGCTREACSFRDAQDSLLYKDSNIQIVGISGDPVEKQKKFVEDQKLPFPVLCDTEGVARKAYHVGKGLFGLSEGERSFH